VTYRSLPQSLVVPWQFIEMTIHWNGYDWHLLRLGCSGY